MVVRWFVAVPIGLVQALLWLGLLLHAPLIPTDVRRGETLLVGTLNYGVWAFSSRPPFAQRLVRERYDPIECFAIADDEDSVVRREGGPCHQGERVFPLR